MDNSWVQYIGSLGFPIVACIGLFWYMTKESENHKSEANALKEAIQKLEIAITTLVQKIGD